MESPERFSDDNRSPRDAAYAQRDRERQNKRCDVTLGRGERCRIESATHGVFPRRAFRETLFGAFLDSQELPFTGAAAR
jgi:hypothetical protein